jgi:hypothetical protein
MGASNDYRVVQRQTQRIAPNPAAVWQVIVTATPATIHNYVRIRTLHGARGRSGAELGLAPWVKPRSKEKPEKGDIGVCVLDETGSPWVVGWKVQ